MNKNIKILLLFTILFTSQIFGQITTSIIDVSNNSQSPVTNCGLIDFGTSSNNQLSFFYKLIQPYTTAQPTLGNLTIYLKGYSYQTGSSRGGSVIITPFLWSKNGSNWEATGYITCNISSSEIQIQESSVYIEYKKDGSSTGFPSCEFPLKKTPIPTFALTPFPTVNVSCGSTAPVTFTVNNVYNSTGTLSYTWNTFGWLYNGNLVGSFTTTSNSITLTPASISSRPSSVNVTTVLDGVVRGGQSCSVSLPAFISNAEITSPSSTLCLGTPSNFTIANLGVGETFIWTISNPSLASINNPNLNTVSVSALQEGNVQLSCTITNSCSQTNIKYKIFNIGKPKPTNQTLTTSNTNVPINSESYFYVSSAVVGATCYDWQIVKLENGSGCGCTTDSQGLIACPSGVIFPKFSSTNTSLTSTNTTNIGVSWGNCPGNYVVNCYARNDCEQVGIGNKVVTVLNQNGGGGNLPCPTSLKIMSNPVKNGIITAKIVNQPCFTPIGLDPGQNRQKSLKENEVQIYNMFGSLVFSKTYNSDDIIVSEANLKSGKYILNVITASGERKREIIIIE